MMSHGRFLLRLAALVLVIVTWALPGYAGDLDRPRLLVLTDIGGDPDDQQSMVRLMLYSNEFQIDGLIASASGTPNELNERVTKPHLIRQIVEAYGEVRPNLIRHASGYPETEQLLGCIKSGNPIRGLDSIGRKHDTEGSRWIIKMVDHPDPRPLHITIWGGQTDLAQTLWRVRADRGEAGLAPFLSRLRVYDIADQDHIHDWIFEQFPDLFYVLSKAPEGEDKRNGAFRGMYLGGDESLTSRAWIDRHVRIAHGPLGSLYPEKTWTAPNKHGVLKEGDTPSWFSCLPNGLNDPAHPQWGGWGGRHTPHQAGLYRDAHDTVGNTTDARTTVSRWRPEFQNELAARMDWCVASRFEQANHSPRAVLNGDSGRESVELTVRSGEQIRLSSEGSSDPDADRLTSTWSVYREAGSWSGDLKLGSIESEAMTLTAPTVEANQSVHVILRVIDDGEPNLTSFRRAVIMVTP